MSSEVASVTITGMDELTRKLAALGADASKIMQSAGLKAMRLNVEAAAKEKAREHNDNGALTSDQGIKTSQVFENGAAIIKTGSTLHDAKYVEFGTGIYATGPGGSRAKRIPWLWKVESRKWAANFGIERGQSVLWYGSRPYPFLRPAFDENKDQVLDDVRADLEAAIGKYTI